MTRTRRGARRAENEREKEVMSAEYKASKRELNNLIQRKKEAVKTLIRKQGGSVLSLMNNTFSQKRYPSR